MANVLCREKRLLVLACLIDGCSERTTERLTGVARMTISKLALYFAERAAWLHNRLVRELRVSLLQFDEQHSTIHTKAKHVKATDPAEYGDVWTWTAMDAASRFIVAWYVGKHDQKAADIFMADVRSRLVQMPMLMTSDGLPLYESSILTAFGPASTYGRMKKNTSDKRRKPSDPPPAVPFIEKQPVFGAPDMDLVSTAYMERQNLTMRHKNGRLRRRCLAFSKTLEHHSGAAALGFVAYNMTSVIATSRLTPAMALGITSELWDVGRLLDELDAVEPCNPPAVQPLAHRTPETTHRELPAGRGYLRALPGGKAPPPPHSPAPLASTAPIPVAPIAPAAPAPIAAAPTHVAPPPPPLRVVKKKPVQLSLFDRPTEPPKGDGVV